MTELQSSFYKNAYILLHRTQPTYFVFFVTLIFYLILWVTNASNKLVVAAFMILPALYLIKFKNLNVSLFLTYLASSIIFSGKSYTLELIPPGVFPLHLYPLGYTVALVFSVHHIISGLIGLLILRDIFFKKFLQFRFSKIDILFLLFQFWLFLSDLFASNRPEISLPFRILSFEVVIVYLFVRLNAKKLYAHISIIIWLIGSIITLESIISIQQFINASPIYRTLESQVLIEYFGKAVDELEFTFRPVGTFDHANNFGAAMVFYLLVFGGFLLRNHNMLLFTIFISGIVTLIMTLSRSAWLGYFFGCMFMLFIIEKIKKIQLPGIITKNLPVISLLSIILVVFFVFPRAEKSLYSFGLTGGGGQFRALQTKDTLALIALHPLFGVGTHMSVQETLQANFFGIFSSVPLAVHNWYLLVMAEHGIPSLIFFILFMILSVKHLFATIANTRINKDIFNYTLSFLATIIAMSTIGFFQPYINEGYIALSLALISDTEKHDIR